MKVDYSDSIPLRLAKGWNRFWFTPADPTLLGLIRILCGLVIFYVYLSYTYDFEEFFGAGGWTDAEASKEFRENYAWLDYPDQWQPDLRAQAPQTEQEARYLEKWGTNPKQTYAKGWQMWSIWFHVTDPFWMKVVHGALLALIVCFTFGFCTRITSVLVWLGALSYSQRSITTVFGMDAIVSFVLLYLMIGPSGAALSVDRLIARYWKTRRQLRERAKGRKMVAGAEEEGARPAPMVSANLALRLMQVHVCMVYLASGLSKLQGGSWWNGTAIWGTLVNFEFSPMHNHYYMRALIWLCKHRWLWELFMTGGVGFTLLLEIGFASLVWNRRLRWLMIFFALMLHAGIGFFMGLVTFSLMMVTAVMSFIPPESLDAFWKRIAPTRSGLRLYFNARNRRQVRAASLVHALDVWSQVVLMEYPSPGGNAADHVLPLQLVTDEGEIRTRYKLFEGLVRTLPLMWPVAWITFVPGLKDLAQAWYPSNNQPPPGVEAPLRAKKEPAEQPL